jgi:hypothetical protein
LAALDYANDNTPVNRMPADAVLTTRHIVLITTLYRGTWVASPWRSFVLEHQVGMEFLRCLDHGDTSTHMCGLPRKILRQDDPPGIASQPLPS